MTLESLRPNGESDDDVGGAQNKPSVPYIVDIGGNTIIAPTKAGRPDRQKKPSRSSRTGKPG